MLVSQKIILINTEGKILALRRSETDPNRPLTWDLPGGAVEEGEDLIESIRREAREETGIEISDITIHDAVAHVNKRGEYWIQIGYVGHVDMPEISLSYEPDQYKWLTKEEFLKLESSSKIVYFLNKL